MRLKNDIIKISVRELVEFLFRSGDLDSRGEGFAVKDAMLAGSRIHRKIQKTGARGYQAEVPLRTLEDRGFYSLELEGRADGIFFTPARQSSKDARKSSSNDLFKGSTEDAFEGLSPKETSQDEKKDHEDSSDVALTIQNFDNIRVFHQYRRTAEEAVDPSLPIEKKGKSDTAAEPVIEEIKGVFRKVREMEAPEAVHLAQAKCYAAIHLMQEGGNYCQIRMIYAELSSFEPVEDEEEESTGENLRLFTYRYAREDLENWFSHLLEQYDPWARLFLDRQKAFRTTVQRLKFPFDYRPGQKEAAQYIYQSILDKKQIFLQAPTGIGKTISTLFPALKAAGEDLADRIFYLTAKTVTQKVAMDTLLLLQKQGLDCSALTFTAKEKACILDKPRCNPESCERAKGHFDRINACLYEMMQKERHLDRDTVQKAAKAYRVCPYELQKDLALFSEVLVLDYNYAFDPQARLKTFTGEAASERVICLIDEAHNLVDRGREMFSSSLHRADLLYLIRHIRREDYPQTVRQLKNLNQELLNFEKKISSSGGFQLLSSVEDWTLPLFSLTEEMVPYLRSLEEDDEKELEIWFRFLEFLTIADLVDENYQIYATIDESKIIEIRLLCVNPAHNLQEVLNQGVSTVFFSATLVPIPAYEKMLSTKKDSYKVTLSSPFDPKKRLLTIGTDVTSRYRDRTPSMFMQYADYIYQITHVRPGNYMVFCPSYAFLEETLQAYQEKYAGDLSEILLQTPAMKEDEKVDFLRAFETQEEGRSRIGFVVLGGIFAEGIDLTGERLIGALILGTGYPGISKERDVLNVWYNQHGMDGFAYAYQLPGMNKVLQAAGRVIRTDADQGIIALLDKRFCEKRMRAFFPADWKDAQATDLPSIHGDVLEFWKNLS